MDIHLKRIQENNIATTYILDRNKKTTLQHLNN